MSDEQCLICNCAINLVYLANTTISHVCVCMCVRPWSKSTDVSRYSGHLEHVFESTTAGVSIQAPQLDIHTVAAGGGSRLFYRDGLFIVGPESAGAHPGPVCYRKVGGTLAVTDANVVLGRVVPEYFPKIFGPGEDEMLDVVGPRKAFEALCEKEGGSMSVEEMAYGFLQVASKSVILLRSCSFMSYQAVSPSTSQSL